MPKTTKSGKAKAGELPAPVERSDDKAQRTFAKTYDAALESSGGVDANATKEHLLGIARRLDIAGRSTMTKDELVDAIQKANEKANAKARSH